jgi:hypothetical protein
VAFLLLIAYMLPAAVKDYLKLAPGSHSVTWLFSNFVHEDWSHLLGNLASYLACTVLRLALALTLVILGFDLCRVERLSVMVHAAALVIAPLAFSVAWLWLAQRYALRVATWGFSTSVAAYFGACAALWMIATAEAFGVKWRPIYVQLQLMLLLLTPASRYPTRLSPWMEPAAPYMPFLSSFLAVLLAVRGPRVQSEFAEKVRARVKAPGRAVGSILALLLLFYPLLAAFMLNSLYPVNILVCDKATSNVVAHFVGMLVGFAFALAAAAAHVAEACTRLSS